MKEFNIESEIQELLKNNLIAFGPKKIGPNFLVIRNIET
jgi:hypothetical protein